MSVSKSDHAYATVHIYNVKGDELASVNATFPTADDALDWMLSAIKKNLAAVDEYNDNAVKTAIDVLDHAGASGAIIVNGQPTMFINDTQVELLIAQRQAATSKEK